MTYDEILNAARERVADIDKQIADLAAERARLQAMLDTTNGGAPDIADALKKMIGKPAPVYIPMPYPVYPELYRSWVPPVEPWGTTITICQEGSISGTLAQRGNITLS